MRREDERKCEPKALSRAAARKTHRADDTRDAAFDALVPRRVFEDLNASDVALAHDGKSDLDLASKVRLVAESGLVAAMDLREVFIDLLANDERIEVARRTGGYLSGLSSPSVTLSTAIRTGSETTIVLRTTNVMLRRYARARLGSKKTAISRGHLRNPFGFTRP